MNDLTHIEQLSAENDRLRQALVTAKERAVHVRHELIELRKLADRFRGWVDDVMYAEIEAALAVGRAEAMERRDERMIAQAKRDARP